jgi:hypothetical protein
MPQKIRVRTRRVAGMCVQPVGVKCLKLAHTIKAPCRLKEAGLEGSPVDFLSVDVEGVELMVRPLCRLPPKTARLAPTQLIFAGEQVLKSIDLAALKFPVIIAENNGGSDALETYLKPLGLNSRARRCLVFPAVTVATHVGLGLAQVH